MSQRQLKPFTQSHSTAPQGQADIISEKVCRAQGEGQEQQERENKVIQSERECSSIRFAKWARLAAASRDNSIYIFDVMRNYKKVDAARGTQATLPTLTLARTPILFRAMMVPMRSCTGKSVWMMLARVLVHGNSTPCAIRSGIHGPASWGGL